jgi:TRAP transporter TAXI family solute receptor
MTENDPAPDESATHEPAPHESASSPIDALWAECLRLVDAGQPLDLQRISGGDPQRLAELQELVEDASWLDGWIETETITLRSHRAKSDEDTHPFIVEKSVHGAVGSLSTIIQQVAKGVAYPFGEYELHEVAGRGGMGVVFRARQKAIGRDVAVKMIAAGRFASRADIERFYSEAKAASAVKHAHIVTIYQVGEIEGHHFYSMDYVVGTDLAERLRSGPIPPRDAAELMLKVARAVHSAHEMGVIHRDLKPANILLDDSGAPQVTDFGLAKLFGQEGDLTATGNAMGTPGYMPPEQATGCWLAVGETSDVYSLGAILYATLTGRAPFKASNPLETMWSVVNEPPARPKVFNSECDPQLESVALKCLEKDPLRRYSTANNLADELQRYLDGEPVQAKPVTSYQSVAHWCKGLPIIAALTGRPIRQPTSGQMRAQAGLGLLLIGLLVLMTLWLRGDTDRRMPSRIRIAGGIAGGMYNEFATDFKAALEKRTELIVEVTTSNGSRDNEDKLRDGLVDLALVQEAAFDGRRDAIVAPLFHEYVHVIARKKLHASTIRDLGGKRVGLGPASTGSRLTANDLVRFYSLETDPKYRDMSWENLLSDPLLDAAIVTVRLKHQGISEMLSTGQFVILGMPDAGNIPDFNSRPVEFPLGIYAGHIPPGTPTLRTTAFLVTHHDASPQLVEAALQALYSTPSLQPFAREDAGNWRALKWHDAALKFFDADFNTVR